MRFDDLVDSDSALRGLEQPDFCSTVVARVCGDCLGGGAGAFADAVFQFARGPFLSGGLGS